MDWSMVFAGGTLVTVVLGGTWTLANNYVTMREYTRDLENIKDSLHEINERLRILDTFMRGTR